MNQYKEDLKLFIEEAKLTVAALENEIINHVEDIKSQNQLLEIKRKRATITNRRISEAKQELRHI